jgi:hypothetical protein
MTLLNLYTNKVVISRLTTVSGDKMSYATATAEYCNIQKLSDEKTLNIGQAVGKTFKLCIAEDTDIQVGDKLKDEHSNEYKVVGVNKPADLGNFVHLVCIINRIK